MAVRFGGNVSAAQAAGLAAAWSRCTGPGTVAPAEVDQTIEALPFAAAVSFPPRGDDSGVRQVRGTTFESLAELLTSQITLLAIQECAGTLTMLHACGLADNADGSVVALVAKSGTGKTTAATHLAQTFGYVTDETVAVTPDGAVVPYPKPLSLKGAGSEPKSQVGPDALGLVQPAGDLRIRAIGLLNRVAGNQEARMEDVPLLDAVVELIPNTSSQAALENPLQSLCGLINRTGGVRRFTYSESADLAAVLSQGVFAGGTVPAAADWVPEDPSAAGEPVANGSVGRLAAVDAVECDGDLLVLNSAGVTRLSGIGPAIWRSTREPITEERLVEVLAAEFGLPEGFEPVLEGVLEDLKSRELISRGPGEAFWGGRTAFGLLKLDAVPGMPVLPG